MKLFSRTSLVALGTAATMAAATLSAPAQAEEVAPAAQVTYLAASDDNSSSSIDVDNISDYVLIVTGVVGILSAALTFATAFERSMK
ncbi:hypothetical protein [Corynebacterium crudilactis]|uniref:Secreted protein n=1 Tax=Corynebacterium crudilactis TaxID=1652495 RepID=A0A172QTY4_9CORY|nr:hypothetical protein [Corynebacterium crudilactis]ANE04153.1 hypothetical protein ccrud_07985 [Corynebacterium crudilactis]